MSIQLLTPECIKEKSRTRTIGHASSPYGSVFVELIDDAIVSIGFHKASNSNANQYASLPIRKDNQRIAKIVEAIFSSEPNGYCYQAKGTPFQVLVWEALLAISIGHTCSYLDIASAINRPHAARAVGNAIGKNPLAIVIPCHRVLLQSGGLGGYRWGIETKRALLESEKRKVDGSNAVLV